MYVTAGWSKYLRHHLISENIFKLSTEIKKDRSNILLIAANQDTLNNLS